jgi:demethylmenaquinone methyltransferase / 2-methoxy-6-polyprenyl-1,4-benzoquinol methylase
VAESQTGEGIAARLFRGLAPSYDRTADWATLFQDRYWKRWVTDRVPHDEGGLALDVGCGTLLLEQRFLGRRGAFVGLDLTDQMLRIGKTKSLSNVALLTRGDAEALPFPDETFDTVVSCYVAKYVKTALFTKELARVTKPGATVVVYDFVRPVGLAAPFLELYIRAGLRVVGFLLSLSGRDSAFTFQRLPRIVDGALWDEELVEAMEKRGFETTAVERLTGGIVFAYCGRK